MRLLSLTIARNEWMPNSPLHGKISFEAYNKSEIELQLTDEHIRSILPIVAEALVAATKELASNLTANIIEHAAGNLLENNEKTDA